MAFFLAKADVNPSGSTTVVLAGTIAFLVAFVLAIVPFLIARSRRPAHANSIAAVAILWGVFLVASVVQTSTAQAKWSQEWLLRVQSGYYDPQDRSDAPPLPWLTWTVLATAYCGMLIWSLARRNP